MTTEVLIFKTRINKRGIENAIKWNKPAREIENRIEHCVATIEVALRLRKMTQDEAEQLLDLQDDLRDLYYEI